MKVLTGHLTATDRKAINVILDAKLLSGKVGKKNYFLTPTEYGYSVQIQVKDRGMMPVSGSTLRISTYFATFKK